MRIFICLLLSITIASALQVRLKWDKNPAADNVTKYRLYKVAGDVRTLLAEVDPTATEDTVERKEVAATTGDVLIVVAYNGVESEASDPVTVPAPPAKPTGLRVVEIQVSSNMKDWKTIALVPLNEQDAPAGFVRAGLATINTP